MTLDPKYFPVFSFIIVVLILSSLYNGWKKGFLYKIIDLIILLLSVFAAIPIAKALTAAYPLLFKGTDWQYFGNLIVYFLLIQIFIRVCGLFFYKAAKWVKKLKVVGLADKITGMLCSAGICWINLCLLVLLLQLPVFINGRTYVESTPLVYVQDFLNRTASSFML